MVVMTVLGGHLTALTTCVPSIEIALLYWIVKLARQGSRNVAEVAEFLQIH